MLSQISVIRFISRKTFSLNNGLDAHIYDSKCEKSQKAQGALKNAVAL